MKDKGMPYMDKQIYNPFLPLTEYIPDGEPHVFGDRVYLYGSHDEAGGDRFCVQDYTVWSAPVDDLTNWTNHGVSYRKDQDLRAKPGKLPDYYAPDCVRGNDGRYYLYYVAMGPNVKNFGPMSAAVSDSPAGPFEYLGDICWPDGTPLLKYLTNDPAVLNDNGRIWLYYGWGFGFDFRSKALGWYFRRIESMIFQRSAKEIKETKPSIMNCVCAELEDDMLTVKGQPVPVLPSKDTAERGSGFYKHPFFEAASIRKFEGLYYLVYSSGVDNALAYATSPYPDRDFQYRGVIVSNSDLGLHGNRRKKAPAGTIHGGIERINGQYYIFYHRCTHNTDFSRQACAEPIEILPDGTIHQVEITSCGLNGGPLEAKGKYPAAICCHLYGKKVPRLGVKNAHKYRRVYEQDSEMFVHDVDNGTIIGYKYFRFDGDTRLRVTIRGNATGILQVMMEENGAVLNEIPVNPSIDWKTVAMAGNLPAGLHPLYLRYRGKGKMDLLSLYFYENTSSIQIQAKE